MLLIFILLNFIFFSKQVEAKPFNYQFIFTNNSINLDFFKVISVEPTVQPIVTETPTPTQSPSPTPAISTSPAKILSFDYKLKKNSDLPLDLPLFLVTFGQEVVFYADASLADNQTHKVEIDLNSFNQDILTKMPVFYQNNYLNDFELEVGDVTFVSEFSSTPMASPQIIDLTAIREKDQSLTIIFTLAEEQKMVHGFELICLNEEQETINSAQLNKKDDFLWSSFSFIKFFSNQKNEVIFHLSEFTCDGLVLVEADQRSRSMPVSIINVEDL